MTKQLSKQIKLYNGKAYGHDVSPYGLENEYLDYYTLSKIVGNRILNNDIIRVTGYENWEIVSGDEMYEDGEYRDIYQYYIISNNGADILQYWTNEIIFYNEELDLYVWGVTHFGTGWDCVLTDIKIEEENEEE